MMMTEQIMMEEARMYMQPAERINARHPLNVKQQRIMLAETGIQYEADTIANRKDLEVFCKKLNENECFEKFSIIAVNTRCKPIGVYSIQGSLNEVSAYPRVVATYALLTNAHSVFLTHNHPGGTCCPSKEDLESTKNIQRVLNALDVLVLDHIITTPEGAAYSMAQHGDLEFGSKARSNTF